MKSHEGRPRPFSGARRIGGFALASALATLVFSPVLAKDAIPNLGGGLEELVSGSSAASQRSLARATAVPELTRPIPGPI